MTVDKIQEIPKRHFVKVPTPNFEPSERWRIMKNILAISCAFMVNFTAFMGAANLQSSINADQSLGTFTLSAIYGSLLFSNIFLPALIISWLGCKWTMSVSIVAYMPFIASQFYPKFYTMIPAGLSVGLGGGPLWCAKCTYLTVVAEVYSSISDVAADVLVTRFFGLFFMFYQMAQVWGNLISSAGINLMTYRRGTIMSECKSGLIIPSHSVYKREAVVVDMRELSENFIIANIYKEKISYYKKVLSYGIDTITANVTLNSSIVAEICGANFCGVSNVENENPNLQPPPIERVYLISGIYLGCMIVACLIIAFCVDSLSRYDRARARSVKGLSGFKLLAVTLKLLKEKSQLLILPITIFIGAEQAFLFADYNASFVSCAWGISNIGYVMICFGVTNAIAAVATGSIVKLTGRKPVIIFAFSLHLSILIFMLKWKPTPEQGVIFFLISGLWGVCDSIWLVQVNSLSGILFPGQEEAAFSNFRLWESTGSVITYIYSPYLCTYMKLYILIGILCAGMAGYSIIEWSGKTDRVVPDEAHDFELVTNNEINR